MTANVTPVSANDTPLIDAFSELALPSISAYMGAALLTSVNPVSAAALAFLSSLVQFVAKPVFENSFPNGSVSPKTDFIFRIIQTVVGFTPSGVLLNYTRFALTVDEVMKVFAITFLTVSFVDLLFIRQPVVAKVDPDLSKSPKRDFLEQGDRKPGFNERAPAFPSHLEHS